MNRPPKTLACDFDGTLCDHEFPGIGAIKPGAREALQRFKALGFTIIIYSCRTSNYFAEIFNPNNEAHDMNRPCVVEMIDFLKKHDIPYDMVDDGTMGKPFADYYIDDKGIRFDDNWDEIADAICSAETLPTQRRICCSTT